jgi:hypothetical protein
MACDVLIDFERVVIRTFCWREFDQTRDEPIFPSEFSNAVKKVRFAAAEVSLNEFEAGALLEKRIEVFMLEDIEIALITDIDAA